MNVVEDAQWMVETQGGVYTPADSTYRMSVRVVNTSSTALGSPDNIAVTGIKVFLPTRPMGYHGREPGDTTAPYSIPTIPIPNINNSVNARNPDGVQSFTAASQPYWTYPQKLEPGEQSEWREWQFTVHPDVNAFYLAVAIFAAAPGQQWLTTTSAPRGWTISADSVAKLYAPGNAVRTHPRLNGPYPRSIVNVIFKRSASLDERQAALDLVEGHVIGGMGGLIYQVLVADDGTGNPLWAAIDRLVKLPQVEVAEPELITGGVTTFYVRPNDGVGWTKADWNLAPDSAAGRNWGVEAIAAPWAWGCETGSTARVAVVDGGAAHSAFVTSIVMRSANDNTDVAGMMWRGNVTTTDFQSGGASNVGNQLVTNIESGFQSQADIFNFSLGAKYQDTIIGPGGTTFPARAPQATQHDADLAQRFANTFAPILKQFETQYNRRPLYVISAGNYQIDALYSGLPQLASDPVLASRVLVVAAATNIKASPTDRRLWANGSNPTARGSSFGSLVNIAAPGYNVYSWNGTGVVVNTGTSFAAPHVTGAAALVKSFDPRLSSDSIRLLLLAGAARGGRTAGQIPFLNAYEALKAAASRHTAPLCGNRVYSHAGAIYVQRDSSDPAAVEQIIPIGASVMDVRHGGKIIVLNGNSTRHVWFNGVWNSISGPVDLNGIHRAPNGSRGSASHDGDTLASLVDYKHQSGQVYASVRLQNAAGTELARPVVDRVWGAWGPEAPAQCTYRTLTGICVFGDPGPGPDPASRPDGEHANVLAPIYSPRGAAVYVAVRHSDRQTAYSDWYSCEGNKECRTTTETTTASRSQVYPVVIPSGVVRPPWSETGRELGIFGVSELGTEMLVMSRPYSVVIQTKWGATPVSTTTETGEPCTMTYRNAATGQVRTGSPVLPCNTTAWGWAP